MPRPIEEQWPSLEPDAPVPSERSGLPNFTRADDILRAAEVFWIRAARVINPDTGEPKAPRDVAFFSYLASELVRMSEQLTRYRHTHQGSHLLTWVQYTPESPLPTEADLAELNAPGVDADAAMCVVNRVNGRWQEVFRELSERVTAVSGRELFESCQELLESRARSLVSACAQRHES